jgi:hypothetical protein
LKASKSPEREREREREREKERGDDQKTNKRKECD